jgi:hypothetical protein
MKPSYAVVSLLMVLPMIPIVGCRDEGGEGGGGLIGTWVRERRLTVGNRTEVEEWTITFNDDGTFVELHRETSDIDNIPLEALESRQGTWDYDGQSQVVLTGDWLDLTGDVSSLDDLAANLFGYQREVMLFLAGDDDLLFIGPDIQHFSTWPFAESYGLLYNDTDNNTLWREYVVELTDAEGTVLERRTESITFVVSAGDTCEGEYSISETVGDSTTESSGPFTSCSYVVSDANVEHIDGSPITVQDVRFLYEADELGDGTQQEWYIQVGDNYLGYNPSEQETALRNSAFVKVD